LQRALLKKFRTIILLLILFGFGASVFADELLEPHSREKVLSVGGSAGQETFENLKSSGVLKLNGTTIKQLLEIQGCLIAQAAKFGSIEAIGEVNLTNSVVSSASTISGYLRAQGTTFKGPLTLSLYKAVFTASKLGAVTIQRQEAFKGKQVIELKQGTVIEGPIIFESGKGEVHLYPGSKIYSSIEGGKLIRKN
jgi:hypothetical protein